MNFKTNCRVSPPTSISGSLINPMCRKARRTPGIRNCTMKSASGRATFQKERGTTPGRAPSRTIHRLAHNGVGSVSAKRNTFKGDSNDQKNFFSWKHYKRWSSILLEVLLYPSQLINNNKKQTPKSAWIEIIVSLVTKLIISTFSVTQFSD